MISSINKRNIFFLVLIMAFVLVSIGCINIGSQKPSNQKPVNRELLNNIVPIPTDMKIIVTSNGSLYIESEEDVIGDIKGILIKKGNSEIKYKIKECTRILNFSKIVRCSVKDLKTLVFISRKNPPIVLISTKNDTIYVYYDDWPNYRIRESAIILRGYTLTDPYTRYLIVCYDKKWDTARFRCEGFKWRWDGDYVKWVDGQFTTLLGTDAKTLTIVVNADKEYYWTIEVYKGNGTLIKKCKKVNRYNPCIVTIS